jgi:hypothetical protein
MVGWSTNSESPSPAPSRERCGKGDQGPPGRSAETWRLHVIKLAQSWDPRPMCSLASFLAVLVGGEGCLIPAQTAIHSAEILRSPTHFPARPPRAPGIRRRAPLRLPCLRSEGGRAAGGNWQTETQCREISVLHPTIGWLRASSCGGHGAVAAGWRSFAK